MREDLCWELRLRRRQALRYLCAGVGLGLPGAWLFAQPAATADAQVPARELLNSERIEQRFGSYGVEVLESGPRLRVSNLYSLSGERRISRTFAVVRYPAEVDPRLAREHRLILDGGSIGAVLDASGWRVEKTHLHFGEIDSTGRSARLMGMTASAKLAVHVYALDAANETARIPYALLAEVHHPHYLELHDLWAIYGDPDTNRDPGAVADLLALVAAKLA